MFMIPMLRMNDGRAIPQVGFGAGFATPDGPEPSSAQVVELFPAAIEAGYRLFDTAQVYGNEEGFGEAISKGGIPREELFITSKLATSAHGREKALMAFDESMRRLRLEVLDLYLIHWPLPMFDEYVETWKALVELQTSGRVRSIGVSNFTEKHLERLVEETGVVPAVNQVELNPEFPQRELRTFHAEHGILTEAWGPLGQGRGLLEKPAVTRLAKEKGKSAAQIVLRWHIQVGNVVIPKSLQPSRLRENVNIFDFELEAREMEQLATLEGERSGPDPEAFEKRF